MVFFLSLFLTLLLCLTAKCEEPLQLLADELPAAAAVHVEARYLKNVSGSVVAAENWLRNNVLARYPATNITTIVVGSTVLCSKHQQQRFGLVLPSIKNIHHSLTRWGLHHEIKVSTAFSSDCLDPLSESYRADVGESLIKPLLTFLKGIAAPYVLVKPPHDSLTPSGQILALHWKSMRKLLGVSKMNVYVLVSDPRRKLSDTSSNRGVNSAFAPLPPLVGSLSPMSSPQFAPTADPPCDPTRVHHGHGHSHGTWCVAKPSVPAETLQEALDYACGDGNVDCEALKQDGSCYYPDSLVSHASYAFNSYWQATKKKGGTCGFAGTAMLVTSDPSYGHCRFALT